MKKIFYCFVFLLICLFCENVQAREEILSFHSDIFIEKDGALFIKEKIKVRAEGNDIKRGIYRDLPLYYANEKTPLEVRSVLRNGKKIPYTFDNTKKSYTLGNAKKSMKRIYMGDMGREIPAGIYEYEIEYIYKNVIRKKFLKKADILHLNLIGNEWRFPILTATATIHFPQGLELLYKPVVYTGVLKSKRQDASLKVYPDTIEIKSHNVLGFNKGMTISAWFKSGVLNIPILTTFQKIDLFFCSIIVLMFISLCIKAYSSWKEHGVDAPLKTIYPRFDIPKSVGIGELVRIFYHNKTRDEQKTTLISAHFADLLQKGFVKIYTDPKGKWIEIKKVENVYPKTPEEEFFVLHAEDVYFLYQNKGHKKFAEYVSDYGDFATEQAEVSVEKNEEKMKDFFSKVCKFCGLTALIVTLLACFRAENIEDALFTCCTGFFGFIFCIFIVAICSVLVELFKFYILFGLFWLGYLAVALMFLFSLLKSFHLSVFLVSSICFGGLLTFIYGKAIVKIDEKSMACIGHLKGIKMFLETAGDLQYKTIKQIEFERLLPYAIILGVQNKWSEKMKKYFDPASMGAIFTDARGFDSFSSCVYNASHYSDLSGDCTGCGSSSSGGGSSDCGGGAGGGGGGGF